MPMNALPLSAKAVLRELEHADGPLSRYDLADRTRLSYSTVCSGINALTEAGVIETVGCRPNDAELFAPACTLRSS